jgi:hypothetical protein
MFEETLAQIAPELEPGSITLIVSNYAAAMELRSWNSPAADALAMAEHLIANATEAVQGLPRLRSAARTLARHAEELTEYRPTFWKRDEKIGDLDEALVSTLHAVGRTIVYEIAEGRMVLHGETVVFSPIFRVGRTGTRKHVKARMLLDGRPCEVLVAASAEDDAWSAARRGGVAEVRLRGRWGPFRDGHVRLVRPEILAISTDFSFSTGRELMDMAARHAELFTTDDYTRMLADIQGDQEE